MNLFCRTVRSLVLTAALFLPLLATAQSSLTFSNGVQTFTGLTNYTVTMTGRSELHVTGTSTPLVTCTINLNSPDAWLFITGIKPSVTVSSYLSQVRINGATAVVDSNCRVIQYGQNGAVVIPYASNLQPLTVYKTPEFGGAATSYPPYTYYTGGGIGAFNSFKLKRGYQVVLAQTADGKNNSKCYIAQDGDLEVGVLPSTLAGQVQFIYVTPLRWTSKKGIGGNPGNTLLNLNWWYDWNLDQNSSRDLEYVAIRQSQYWPSMSQNWQSRGINTVLGYNEPDQANQANMSVSTAISSWGDVLGTGLRAGSPATSDGGRSSWLYPFVSQADAAGLRVDYVAIHYYQSHNPADASGCASQMYSFLLDVWNNTHRPIWVTEWNNGANWTDSTWPAPTYAQQQACIQAMVNMLESTPFVERYALYNWVENPRALVTNNVITGAGLVYSNTVSGLSYVQVVADNGVRGIGQYLFNTNVWDTSGFCNNGMTIGGPTYTTGHNAQSSAVVLDGTNNYVQLSANMAKSSGFTFAAWVYWNGGANWQRIFDFGADTTHYMFLSPSSGSGTLRFAIANGGSEQRVETSALPGGSWQHVAITLSGSTATLYLNGAQVATSGSFSILPSAFNPMKNYLGKSQFPADPLFNGQLDSVIIKDYAMTSAQIAALQTSQPPQFTNNTTILGAHATQGIAYSGSLAGAATNFNTGDTLTYSKATGPAWLSIAADGTLSGSPTSGDGGTNYFTVAVSDGAAQNAFITLAIPVTVFTANGTWISDASANWSDTSRWSSTTVASGAGQTANFSTINITANRSVTLDSSRSIGNLKFSDTTAPLQNWTVASGNNSVLTLDTSSATSPLFSVTNTATISAPLAGTNGFTKTGPGTLILSGNNPLTGTVYVDTGSTANNDGILRLAGPDVMDNASLISIRNNNSGSSTLQVDGSAGGITINANFTATYRNNGVVTIENLNGTNVFNGSFQLFQGGNSFTVQSDSGLVVFTGTNQYVGGLVGARTDYFTGSGNHLMYGPILNSTNGSAISVTKSGTGTLTLAGANTWTSSTTLSGGTMLVDGVLPSAPLSVTTGTTLGGNGVINAAVSMPAGSTLSPGDSFGTLTISNSLTLQPGSITYLEINKANTTNNDLLAVTGLLTYGGTLIVSNAAGTLWAGDNFQLVNASSISGDFASLNLPTLPNGFNWNWSAASGSLSISSTVALTPPAVQTMMTAGTLSLTWPADHTGWRLVAQTNDWSTGLGTNWMTVPGSTTTNQMTLTIDPANPTVMYQLVFP